MVLVGCLGVLSAIETDVLILAARIGAVRIRAVIPRVTYLQSTWPLSASWAGGVRCLFWMSGRQSGGPITFLGLVSQAEAIFTAVHFCLPCESHVPKRRVYLGLLSIGGRSSHLAESAIIAQPRFGASFDDECLIAHEVLDLVWVFGC